MLDFKRTIQPRRLPIEIWNIEYENTYAIVVRNSDGSYAILQEFNPLQGADHFLIGRLWREQQELVKKLNKKWWEFWK